ncbi:predicted protein [Chaetoceros tenuissimus]|uniref:Uncharacterized protein n=1 Tax=Chaetoceros tenuissimus TaxID=426638 RepID=A0AAD3DCB6_9STRA|nr:predicted protein [Chaetoceros tenuissimus]
MVSINQRLKSSDPEELGEGNGGTVNDEELDDEEKNLLFTSKILEVVESKLENERFQREEALSWCQMTLQRERTERLRERHDLLKEREDMESRLQELENLLTAKDEKSPPRRNCDTRH